MSTPGSCGRPLRAAGSCPSGWRRTPVVTGERAILESRDSTKSTDNEPLRSLRAIRGDDLQRRRVVRLDTHSLRAEDGDLAQRRLNEGAVAALLDRILP